MNEKSVLLLCAVKERLFTTGWQKGSYGSDEGPNCIVGALDCEEAVLGVEKAVVAKAQRSLYRLPGVMGNGIVSFNDRPGTTFDDIIELLDKAIKQLESE